MSLGSCFELLFESLDVYVSELCAIIVPDVVQSDSTIYALEMTLCKHSENFMFLSAELAEYLLYGQLVDSHG